MIGQLGDVNHSIFAGQEFHKYPIAFDPLDLTGVNAPDFCVFGQALNFSYRTINSDAIRASNEHGSIIFNVNFDSKALLQRANGLASRPDHQPDLVGINLERDHARRRIFKLHTRLCNSF